MAPPPSRIPEVFRRERKSAREGALPLPLRRARKESQSHAFVLEVSFALQRLGIFILAQNILFELHIGPAKILEESLDTPPAAHHFLSQIICIDVDTDRAHHAEFRPVNRDGGALEFSRADIQLVVELFLVLKLSLLQIDEKIGGPIAQMPAGGVILQANEGV